MKEHDYSMPFAAPSVYNEDDNSHDPTWFHDVSLSFVIALT